MDVLFLYSEDGLVRRGVTAEQMETMIADELPLTNEATANSDVDLRFNLVHVAQVGGVVQCRAQYIVSEGHHRVQR